MMITTRCSGPRAAEKTAITTHSIMLLVARIKEKMAQDLPLAVKALRTEARNKASTAASSAATAKRLEGELQAERDRAAEQVRVAISLLPQ